MTRDIEDRLDLMTYGTDITVKRLALNQEQIALYQPPPNPAKLTDSRAEKYVNLYGAESWELDALEPQILDSMIEDTITAFLDEDLYDEMIDIEEARREAIREAARSLDQREG